MREKHRCGQISVAALGKSWLAAAGAGGTEQEWGDGWTYPDSPMGAVWCQGCGI